MWLAASAMTQCPSTPRRAPKSRRKPCSTRSRPQSFTPVKLRTRKDGWSLTVQCAFLAQLYVTGSVAAAAKAVGRSRASAYKLRQRPGATSFAKNWDAILAGPQKGPQEGPLHLQQGQTMGQGRKKRRRVADWRKLTQEELFWRVEQGQLRPVIYRGKMRSIAQKPDNSALLRLLSRLDRGHKSQPSKADDEGGIKLLEEPTWVCQTKRKSQLLRQKRKEQPISPSLPRSHR